MVKTIALAGFLVVAATSPLPVGAVQPAQQPVMCLHGPSESAIQQDRRQQALMMAQDINRAENATPRETPPGRNLRVFRPFDQLQNVRSAPAGFRLQFFSDATGYSFSLTDTRDGCHYAIFSNQDQWIYEATPRPANARVVPAEVP